MRGVGMFILGLGALSLVGAVVIAAASGLIVMAVVLGTACVMLAAVGIAVLRAVRRARVGERLPAAARITAVVDTGMSSGAGSEVVLDLDVQLPGRPSYRVTVASVVPRAAAGRCDVGRTVPVQVRPGDPADVVVDWAGTR